VLCRRLPIALLLAVMSAPLAAQNYREVTDVPASPRTLFGINLQLGFPQGEFAEFVGTGYGVGGNFTFFLDRRRQAGLRLFFSWIQYGRTTERLPLSPTLPGLLVDLTTANDIYSFGIGPEFHLASGRFRPYVHAAIGTSDFATTTSAEGTNTTSPFASTTNFNDWTFAWYGGGGVQVQVSGGRRPVFIDGGLRYQSHGRTRYLREGSITPTPGGGVSFSPIESKTDLVIVHAGVQIGI
jgi:opacity protein-like surface antigen